MTQLLDMTDPQAVTALLSGLRRFQKTFHAGGYARPNIALTKAFKPATKVTGLPLPKARVLDASETSYGSARNGELGIRVDGNGRNQIFSTGLFLWRCLYFDTIVAWVVAHRCNGRRIIRSPVSESLIKRTLAAYSEQTLEPLETWFLRRVLSSLLCRGRAPLKVEQDLADQLIVSYRDRQEHERPVRVFGWIASWQRRIESGRESMSLSEALSLLGSPPIYLFGGKNSARFQQVSQMKNDDPALREALLAELSNRLDPAEIAAAEEREANQFHQRGAEEYAKDCLDRFLNDGPKTSRLLELIFADKGDE